MRLTLLLCTALALTSPMGASGSDAYSPTNEYTITFPVRSLEDALDHLPAEALVNVTYEDKTTTDFNVQVGNDEINGAYDDATSTLTLYGGPDTMAGCTPYYTGSWICVNHERLGLYCYDGNWFCRWFIDCYWAKISAC